jgi:hypothetical protein
MAESLYNIIAEKGANAGTVYPLQEGATVLGRSSKCELQIEDDTEVSREHVRITFSQGTVMVEDLGSTHGTYLNDHKLHGAVSLTIGDRIRVGQNVFRLDMPTYSSTSSDDEGATVPMDSGQSAPSHDRTAFDSDEMDPATRIDSVLLQLEKEHKGAATRVFQADQTRMLEGAELQDLKPGRAKERSGARPLLGLLVILILFVVVLVVIKGRNDRKNALPTIKEFRSETWSFGLTHPAGWEPRGGKGEQVGVFNVVQPGNTGVLGKLAVFGKNSDTYSYQTMTDEFTQYVTDRRSQMAGFSLLRSEPAVMGNAKVIYYTYRSAENMGAGIFLLDGKNRLGLEGQATTANWQRMSGMIDEVLSTFYLVKRQKLLSYPPPNERIKDLASRDAKALLAEATTLLLQAEDLEKRRDVHYANMYGAVQAYEGCLQCCAALSVRPEFYRRAAERMVEAQHALSQMLYEQKATILQAFIVNDQTVACNECQIMLMMIPDPSHSLYQLANKRIQRFCK